MTVTRFAPSPNGPLHWGHAYSAIVAHDLARAAGGRFLLRIEDIDGPRSRPELAEEFRKDLAWLGLEWDEVPAQGTRLARYEEALDELDALGVLYPCTCTRAEIAAAASETGPEGPIYPGTCRHREVRPAAPAALRMDLSKALAITGLLSWHDDIAGEQAVDPAGLAQHLGQPGARLRRPLHTLRHPLARAQVRRRPPELRRRGWGGEAFVPAQVQRRGDLRRGLPPRALAAGDRGDLRRLWA